MKKLLALLVALICVFAIAFTACSDNNEKTDKEGENKEQTDGDKKDENKKEDDDPDTGEESGEHKCKYEAGWTFDESTHWHASACTKHPKKISEEAPHEFTSLTGTCSVCNASTPSLFSKGEKVPYFSFSTYANSTATYSTESAKGKVLVVNFWYTGCAPCEEEMPTFGDLCKQYGDDIVIVALHEDSDKKSGAEQCIKSNGWSDYDITFGLDKSNIIFKKLGGTFFYPVTVVIDGEGIIVEVIDGKVIRQEGLGSSAVIVDYINPAIKKALGR